MIANHINCLEVMYMKYIFTALLGVLLSDVAMADVISNYSLSQARFSDGTVLRGVWSYNKTRDAVISARFEAVGKAGETLYQWQDNGVELNNAKELVGTGDVRFQLKSPNRSSSNLYIHFTEASGRLVLPPAFGSGTALVNPLMGAFAALTQYDAVQMQEDCASTQKNLQTLAHCAGYEKSVYRGQRPSDVGGTVMIRNPERGFRHEAMASLGPLSQPFYPKMDLTGDALSRIYQKVTYNPRDYFNGEQYQVVQQYIYLDKYTKSADLTAALVDLEHVFSQAKKARVKLLLIFAYRYKGGISEPNPQLVRRHMLALQPVLANHLGEIYAFQFGWFGLWGELHSSGYSVSQKKFILDSFLETMPPDRKITIRNTAYRNLLVTNSEKNNATVGFFNAFYTMDSHPLAAGNDYTPGSRDFNDAVKWGPSTIVDIEMPYTSPINPETGDYLHNEYAWYMNHVPKNFAWGTISRFSKMGVSTFSISHCLSPCINSLRLDRVDLKTFRDLKIVAEPDYFSNDVGFVGRSAFEYIRDHLGYRLRLTEAVFPVTQRSGQAASFSFKLGNSGFSRPVNQRPVDVVLLDNADRAVWRQRTYSTSGEWRPGFEASITLPNRVIDVPPGRYRVAVSLPDPSRESQNVSAYAIQLANGGGNFNFVATETDRFNVIGAMNVTAGR
jgi:hypothetical protein